MTDDVVLHLLSVLPAPAVDLPTHNPDGSRPVVEIAGYYRWSYTTEGAVHDAWGGSLVATWRHLPADENLGFGLIVHLPRNWSIGVTYRDHDGYSLLVLLKGPRRTLLVVAGGHHPSFPLHVRPSIDSRRAEATHAMRPAGLQSRSTTPAAPHPPPELDATAQLFKAAGSPIRLKILYLLGHTTELNVTELAEALQVPITTASRHIGILHTHRLLTPRHEGLARYYRLTANPFNKVLRTSLFTLAMDDPRGRGW